MKNKILILIIFFCAFEISTAQSKQINEGVYKFEINKKYELVEKENNELHFTHFDQAGKLKIFKKNKNFRIRYNPKKITLKKFLILLILKPSRLVLTNSIKKKMRLLE
nr:hypothetical protein [Zobellia laminariae]